MASFFFCFFSPKYPNKHDFFANEFYLRRCLLFLFSFAVLIARYRSLLRFFFRSFLINDEWMSGVLHRLVTFFIVSHTATNAICLCTQINNNNKEMKNQQSVSAFNAWQDHLIIDIIVSVWLFFFFFIHSFVRKLNSHSNRLTSQIKHDGYFRFDCLCRLLAGIWR